MFLITDKLISNIKYIVRRYLQYRMQLNKANSIETSSNQVVIG